MSDHDYYNNEMHADAIKIQQLSEQLAAATARAEAAEAKLAAVPVEDIRTAMWAAVEICRLPRKRQDVQQVFAWLSQRKEVQP